MSSLAKIREGVLRGSILAPPPPKANNSVVLEKPIDINASDSQKSRDSDSDDEEEIWEPSSTQEETLKTMDFFEDAHFNSLKKKEKKESYKNFIDWLTGEVDNIVTQEVDKLDLLFE